MKKNTLVLEKFDFTYLNQNVLEILSQSLPSLFMENRLFMSTTALRDIDTPGGQCPITINLRKFLSMKNNDKTNPNTETKLPQVNKWQLTVKFQI